MTPDNKNSFKFWTLVASALLTAGAALTVLAVERTEVIKDIQRLQASDIDKETRLRRIELLVADVSSDVKWIRRDLETRP